MLYIAICDDDEGVCAELERILISGIREKACAGS